MPLPTLVKLNEVRSLAEARYGAGMGVDMLGFALENDHPCYITPARFQETAQWLSGVKLVGEINNPTPQAIEQVLQAYSLDYLQLHDAKEASNLDGWGLPLLIKVKLRQRDSLDMLQRKLASYGTVASYFLLEVMTATETGFLQATIDHLAAEFPVIQSFSYVPSAWPHALAHLQGIAIKHTADELDQLVVALEDLMLTY